MHNTLTIAILAGLGGMFGWGSADFFAKKTIDKAGPIKSLVWAHGYGTAILGVASLVYYCFLGGEFYAPHSFTVWLKLIFFGVLQMLVYWLAYVAFEKGQVAILNPIFASYSGIVALIAIVAFGETVHSMLIVGLALMFIGIMLLNIDPGGLTKRFSVLPGVKEILAASLLAAIWTIGWDRFINGQSALFFSFCMYGFMTIAALILARLTSNKVMDFPPKLIKFTVLIGLGEALAYFAISWGFSNATNHASVVALISGAFSLPTILLSVIFLKERLKFLQTLAVVVIIFGIALISTT